jgi:hypothetical protein
VFSDRVERIFAKYSDSGCLEEFLEIIVCHKFILFLFIVGSLCGCGALP